MSERPKILCVSDSQHRDTKLLGRLAETFDVVEVQSPIRALACLTRESFAGMYVMSEHFGEAVRLGRLLQNERILEGIVQETRRFSGTAPRFDDVTLVVVKREGETGA